MLTPACIGESLRGGGGMWVRSQSGPSSEPGSGNSSLNSKAGASPCSCWEPSRSSKQHKSKRKCHPHLVCGGFREGQKWVQEAPRETELLGG